jgi:hypothetical protein
MPDRETILREKTYKEEGIELDARVFYTLADDPKLQVHRNSKMISFLVEILRERNLLTDDQIDAMLFASAWGGEADLGRAPKTELLIHNRPGPHKWQVSLPGQPVTIVIADDETSAKLEYNRVNGIDHSDKPHKVEPYDGPNEPVNATQK